ncbi:MAG: hypothetical protein KIS75_10710 [Chromatiales bacterium]|nr:hypothetical protein [Chromatiales bacterium]
MVDMTAVLVRNEVSDDYVAGVMFLDGDTFATLEPAWKHNLPNISCIPAGEYACQFLPRSASGKYREVFHLQAVPDRSGILIHAGNLAKHTKGCILLGTRKGYLAGKRAVLNSRTAMQQLRDKTGKDSFTLSIYGGQHA